MYLTWIEKFAANNKARQAFIKVENFNPKVAGKPEASR